MISFSEANQVRLALKMTCSQHSWYVSSNVLAMKNEGYMISVHTKMVDNNIRKIIPPVINGVNIKIEVSNK